MILPPALLSLLLLAGELSQPRIKIDSNSSSGSSDGTTPPQSRWRHRTAKRRERTQQLLNRIETSNVKPPLLLDTQCQRLADNDIPTLLSPPIDWDGIDSELDPIRGGKIRPDTPRGARKRAQVEAFAYLVSELLKKKKKAVDAERRRCSIFDAGSGAGNLAIPLAGLLDMEGFSNEFDILAVDVNEFALQRLADRAKAGMLADGKVRTLVADLADTDGIISGDNVASDRDILVVSLHACGAASDYAMELAYKMGAPYAICPCCTAKSLTKREDSKNDSRENQVGTKHKMNTSFKRSGATHDITYPRSKWLSDIITSLDSSNTDNEYEILAKIADVGLGPQTPAQQREHQRRAKKIIEMDRLASSAENHDYETRLLRIQHHDPHVYGKGELLLGAMRGSIAAEVFGDLLCR